MLSHLQGSDGAGLQTQVCTRWTTTKICYSKQKSEKRIILCSDKNAEHAANAQ